LAGAQNQTNERAQWFTDSRFGMFIHWGIYSGAEGFWKGEKLRNDNDYAEWIMYRNRIDKDEYLTLLDRFDWDEIDPEEWVILAKKSGMKYVTITAKHHDGFGLWNSKVSDFDLGNFTDRDIIKELSEACQKHGLKLGLYYSHWVDWEHEFGWDHTKALENFTSEDYDRYWQGKVIPQVRELLTNYGDISMLWFDMWLHHSETIVTKEQLLQLKSLIRDLQPDCVVNSRLGLSIEEDPDIDYKTLGDNQLGSRKEDFPWQSPATVAHSWGFHKSDTEWKSTSTLLKSLIGNVSLNGNFMLNIGPRANGEVPFEIEQRMLEMGKWLKVNGEAIYGAEAFDLRENLHDWGKITAKKEASKTKLYLHVYTWPLDKKIPLTGITTTPSKIYLLADKQESPLDFSHSGAFAEIQIPELAPDPYVSVIVLEYPEYPKTAKNLVAKTVTGGFSLTPFNAFFGEEDLKTESKSRRGTIPEHTLIENPATLKWKIYVDKPGTKNIDVSYSFQQDESDGSMVITANETEITHSIQPTGKTIGEPNTDWVIDNFKSHRIGQIDFPEKGFFDIELDVSPSQQKEVKFQWIWIK
jgi:alpha-L-fucosidase